MRQIMGFPQENLPASRVYSTKATSPASTRRSILRVLLPNETSSLGAPGRPSGPRASPRERRLRNGEQGRGEAPTSGTSGTELTHELPAELEVGRAVKGLIEDMVVLMAQADATEAVVALGHPGAANQVRAADGALSVGAMVTGEQAA